MTGIPVIPAMTDFPGESNMPGIPLLTGITDKQNKNLVVRDDKDIQSVRPWAIASIQVTFEPNFYTFQLDNKPHTCCCEIMAPPLPDGSKEPVALDAPYNVLHPHPEVVQHLMVGCEWSISGQTKQYKKYE